MKKLGRKILAITSLSLALIMILAGVMGYLLISHEPNIDDIISKTQKEFAENKNKRQEKIDKAEYGGEVTHVEGAAIAEARENYSSSIEEYGIGSVYIPTSDISLPLLAGMSEWNLLNGVATASADQTLGEGLFIGMSHNLVNERLLKTIDQARKGDLVYLTDFNDVYIYKISEQTVVHETESSYLKEPEEGEDAKLLLYRCEGKYNTDWRRIIYGDYVEKKKLQEVDAEILSGLMIDYEVIEGKEELESDSSETQKEESQPERNQGEERHREKKSKNIFEQTKINLTEYISQTDFLSHLSLRVYGVADSYPIAFFIGILILFIVYYLA